MDLPVLTEWSPATAENRANGGDVGDSNNCKADPYTSPHVRKARSEAIFNQLRRKYKWADLGKTPATHVNRV